MEKKFSEYVEGVSCLHGDGKPNWTYCGKCGSRCIRNEEGKIINYVRGSVDGNPRNDDGED